MKDDQPRRAMTVDYDWQGRMVTRIREYRDLDDDDAFRARVAGEIQHTRAVLNSRTGRSERHQRERLGRLLLPEVSDPKPDDLKPFLDGWSSHGPSGY